MTVGGLVGRGTRALLTPGTGRSIEEVERRSRPASLPSALQAAAGKTVDSFRYANALRHRAGSALVITDWDGEAGRFT